MAGIRARRKAQRPGEILEAAFDEFVAKGYAAARVEDIAARLSITKGTIYLYFPTKEALFDAAIRTVGSVALAQLVDAEPRWTDNIAEDLRRFLTDFYDLIGSDTRARETLRLLIAEGPRLPQAVEAHFISYMDPIFHRLRNRVEQAIATGSIRGDIPYLAELIVSTAFAQHVILMLFSDGRAPMTEVLLQSNVKFLFGGVLPEKTDDVAVSWSAWRPAPELGGVESITAPIGSGLFEVRHRLGQQWTGSAESVVSRLITLFLNRDELRRLQLTGPKEQHSLRLKDLEYRTAGCATLAEAERLARALHERGARPAPDHPAQPGGGLAGGPTIVS